MWAAHGKAGGSAPGVVSRPYTLADARARLAEVSGSREFADTFFAKYIEGREVADYARLLVRAGLVLRRRNAGRAWIGEGGFEPHAQGVRISRLIAPGTPAYAAGLENGDVIVTVAERPVASAADIADLIAVRQPGDRMPVRFIRRGAAMTSTLVVAEDPALELVALESAGGALTPEQHAFRAAWLASRAGLTSPAHFDKYLND
jgi:predicted metalloprotease with PDZ domain